MEKNLDNVVSSEENTLNNSPINENENNTINENQTALNENDVVDVENNDENNESNSANENKGKTKILKILSKILNWASVIIIGFLLIVVGWLSIDKFILKSRAPSIFGYSYFIVETGSMNGLDMNEGDLIFVKPADRYITGDIITFFQTESTKIPTTHRIVKIEDGGFVTKGDANNTEDTVIVSQEMIVGKVVKVVPHVGTFFRWIKEGGGFIYVITFVVIIGIGIYIVRKE